MIRAVLDANVFVSACIQPLGPSGEVVRRAIEPKSFQLVTSNLILAEVRQSLRYPRVRKHLRLTEPEIERLLTSLAVLADMVPGLLQVRAVRSDPDDDPYLAAAVEGLADYLVSGDRHLLEVGEYEAVRIVTPREFLGPLSK